MNFFHSVLAGTAAVCVLAAGHSIANAAPAQAADPVQARATLRRGLAAYEAKDFPAYLGAMRSAHALQPDHPTFLYNLAGALALNGRGPEAAASLERVAVMGVFIPAEKDDDFASIRETAAFRKALAALRANREPRVHSRTAFTFPGRGRIIESVVKDPKTGAWYAASARENRILRVPSEGGAALEFSDPADGLWSALGMRLDGVRRALWVATSESEASFASPAPAKPMRSALVRYDLATGRLAARYPVPEDGVRHMLGDCLVRADGAVFATDSTAPVVWWLPPGAAALERFAGDPRFLSLQGLAFSADQKTLFLADYSSGLLRVDMGTREVLAMPTPAGATLLGIDGLWWHRGSLIGTQNGINPQRVVRVPLDAALQRALKVEVLESGNPSWEEITLGTIVGDELFFVANSEWNKVEQIRDGTARDLRDPLILRLGL